MDCDFGGYATKNDVRCDDGRIIKRDAFIEDDGLQVPLVWNHNHRSPDSVLGHAILENRNDGVYAYCFLNNTPAAKRTRDIVKHGDVACLSIFANRVKQHGPEVVHGKIREVSVVLAGCNPEGKIDNVNNKSVVMHSDLDEDDAYVIWSWDKVDVGNNNFKHGEDDNMKDSETEKEETMKDIFNTLNEKQKNVVYEMIGIAIDSVKNSLDEEEEKSMKHNIFDVDSRSAENENMITDEEITGIFNDAKRFGTLSESCIQHGITNLEYLFPDEKTIDNQPSYIKRDTGWVSAVMNGVHRTAFSRVKSLFADLREDDARARGYIKGNLKKEEVFSLLKRTTSPQTIYKKQKIDRDDVVDITSFDVVAWIKSEMRIMLEEEIARAVLIGDGRVSSSDDKIKEDCIRPIAKDAELYTIQTVVTGTGDEMAKNFIRQAILARKDYKGSGNPDLFTTEEMIANLLLLTDTTGRDLFSDIGALSRKLRVRNIVSVPVMDGGDIYGIIVNLNDYNIGADRGGAVTMFDDFDIDYNAQKYLIETRCSGALIRPYSAIVLKKSSGA